MRRRNCNSQPNTQIINVGVDSLHSRHFIVSWFLLSDLSLIVLHYYNHSTTETAVVVLNIVWWDLKVIKQCIVLCASLTSGNFSSSRAILCYSIILFFSQLWSLQLNSSCVYVQFKNKRILKLVLFIFFSII